MKRIKGYKYLVFLIASTVIANVAAYLLSALAAIFMPPEEFARFAALLGISIIVGALALSYQAVAAKFIVDKEASSEELLGNSLQAGILLSILGLLLGFSLASALNLTPISIALIVASISVSIPGFTAMGIAQGNEDIQLFSYMYGMLGIFRALIGVVFIYASPTALSGALGTFIGSTMGSILILFYAKSKIRLNFFASPIAKESLNAFYAILGFLLIANIDLPLSRALLSSHDAKLYAAGALLSKVAFFLPSFVLFAFLSGLSQSEPLQYWKISVASTFFIGVSAVLVSHLTSESLTIFFDEYAYEGIQDVAWIFVLQGALFALFQVLIYARLAQRDISAIRVTWIGFSLYAILLSALTPSNLISLLMLSISISFGLSIFYILKTLKQLMKV